MWVSILYKILLLPLPILLVVGLPPTTPTLGGRPKHGRLALCVAAVLRDNEVGRSLGSMYTEVVCNEAVLSRGRGLVSTGLTSAHGRSLHIHSP